MTSSPFRFLTSRRQGQYSVRRGEEHIGYVTKIVHRISERGVTRTIIAGWAPSTLSGVDLAIESTREAAARVLWYRHQAAR